MPLYKKIFTNPIYFLAFGFGSGLSPLAPGTCGTIIGVILYYFLRPVAWPIYSLILLMAILIGIYLCDKTEKALGVKDPSGIVWDEICGYGLTMIAAPKTALSMAVGFCLFRLFDIWKPWPIGWVDKKVRGGLGVMLDDLVAAVYAGVLLEILLKLSWI